MQIALLESEHAPLHREGGALTSLTIHALVIGFAIQITAGVGRQLEQMRVEQVTFARLEPKAAARAAVAKVAVIKVASRGPTFGTGGGGGGGGPVLGVPGRGFQVLVAPNAVPNGLPAIDYSKAVTDEADFSGRGRAGGVAGGVAGGILGAVTERPVVETVGGGDTYLITQVEKAAEALRSNVAPRYPDALRAAQIEGKVTVSYVVDTAGLADLASFRVIESTHPLFDQAVRLALPQMRYAPAEIGKTRVRMLVRQDFNFSLVR